MTYAGALQRSQSAIATARRQAMRWVPQCRLAGGKGNSRKRRLTGKKGVKKKKKGQKIASCCAGERARLSSSDALLHHCPSVPRDVRRARHPSPLSLSRSRIPSMNYSHFSFRTLPCPPRPQQPAGRPGLRRAGTEEGAAAEGRG